MARTLFDSDGSPRLEVIVVAYRSSDVLGPCLESLLQSPQVTAVHVVNNSPEAPLGIKGTKAVRVYSPGSNLGFGNGVNYAAREAQSEFVAIVNPDTVTWRGTIEVCTRFLSDNPDVALVSPRVYVNGRLFRTSERAPSLLRFLAYPLGLGGRFGVSRRESDHLHTHDAVALNGAYLVARKSALDKVGWFDPDIFLFGEETDLCRRLRAAGYRISYLSQGRVDHVDGLSSERASFDISALRISARTEQLRRYRGRFQASLYEKLAEGWSKRRNR